MIYDGGARGGAGLGRRRKQTRHAVGSERGAKKGDGIEGGRRDRGRGGFTGTGREAMLESCYLSSIS